MGTIHTNVRYSRVYSTYTTHYTLITISKNKILHFSFSSLHWTDFPLVKQRRMILFFLSFSLIYLCSPFIPQLALSLILVKRNSRHSFRLENDPAFTINSNPTSYNCTERSWNEKKVKTIHGRIRVEYMGYTERLREVAANADTRKNI